MPQAIRSTSATFAPVFVSFYMSFSSSLSRRVSLAQSRGHFLAHPTSAPHSRPAARLAVLAQQVKTEKASNGAVHTRDGEGIAAESNGARTAEPPTPPAQSAGSDNPRIHVIAGSRWPNGIPAVMGAHLLASGAVAPISTTKGGLQPNTSCTKVLSNFFPLAYSAALISVLSGVS